MPLGASANKVALTWVFAPFDPLGVGSKSAFVLARWTSKPQAKQWPPTHSEGLKAGCESGRKTKSRTQTPKA
jgi:hypothetical protein